MVKALKQKKEKLSVNIHSIFEQNHKLTDYYQIRKSDRRTKREVQEERRKLLEYALRKGVEDGLEVKCIENKGRGVFTTRDFLKGEFVVEYCGELIDINEAYRREKKYEMDENTGCYMYYFKYDGHHYCVDATEETDKKGRLINHSRTGNLLTRTIIVENVPRLALIAKSDIQKGEELLYDYGDRSKESLRNHPWLAS
ncbi:unnamed protein product [Callosobruchus maculatus]|uniref:[histone H4]-lysine(20) N-methyltransferase n=1 Tax=Callosobruchus maculatus TaxID=64391 RepID=A0A653C277_CALMS|nr:unnamed protein product [Callosobruchus maculatus]